MTITVGTDSYISLADAETYFLTRLNTTNWDAATDANKEKALKQATRELDQLFSWRGSLYDYDQALDWPRVGVVDCDGRSIDSDEIPSQIEDATCEMALWYFDGNSTSSNSSASNLGGLSKVKVSSIEFEYDSQAYNDAKSEATYSRIPATVINAVGCLGDAKTTGSSMITR